MATVPNGVIPANGVNGTTRCAPWPTWFEIKQDMTLVKTAQLVFILHGDECKDPYEMQNTVKDLGAGTEQDVLLLPKRSKDEEVIAHPTEPFKHPIYGWDDRGFSVALENLEAERKFTLGPTWWWTEPGLSLAPEVRERTNIAFQRIAPVYYKLKLYDPTLTSDSFGTRFLENSQKPTREERALEEKRIEMQLKEIYDREITELHLISFSFRIQAMEKTIQEKVTEYSGRKIFVYCAPWFFDPAIPINKEDNGAGTHERALLIAQLIQNLSKYAFQVVDVSTYEKATGHPRKDWKQIWKENGWDKVSDEERRLFPHIYIHKMTNSLFLEIGNELLQIIEDRVYF